jgi:hypothetical protein
MYLLGSEMLWAAHTSELTIHHDGNSRTQELAFIHLVRCEHNGAVIVDHTHQGIPDVSSHLGVHSSCRLILQNQQTY